jgi:hypothetical protein
MNIILSPGEHLVKIENINMVSYLLFIILENVAPSSKNINTLRINIFKGRTEV